MTSMPRWSQASSNSGVGGLCEVRQALQPISLSVRMPEILPPRRAGPRQRPAWSWWLQVPLSFTGQAVEQKALFRVERDGANAEVRFPCGPPRLPPDLDCR